MSLGRQTLNQQLMLQALHTMFAQTSECEKLDSLNLDLQLQLEPGPQSDMLQFNSIHFDVVFVTLSSICDKTTAYNCIGRVYCLHSVCVFPPVSKVFQLLRLKLFCGFSCW